MFLDEIGLPRLELPDFPLSAPLPVPRPSVPHVRFRDPVEAIGCVELRGPFQGEGLVVDEAVLARRTDRVLVQLRGVALPAFDPRPVGGDQRGTLPEICRTLAG